MKWIVSIFTAVILALLSNYVVAALLNVTPLTLTLTHEEPITTMTVTNSANEHVTLQVDVNKWLQKDGVDVGLPADEILVSPLMFDLAPHQSQLLRISWANKQPLTTQLTYRVLLREVSFQQQVNMPRRGLHVLLALSLPLFVQPTSMNTVLQWDSKWIDKNTLKLRLNNIGNTTLLLGEIQLLSDKKEIFYKKNIFTYVLPAQQHVWLLKVNKQNFNHIRVMANGEWNIASVHINT